MRCTYRVTLALAVVARLAAADDIAPDLDSTLAEYARNTTDLKDYLSQAIDERWPITGCTAALSAATTAGATVTGAQRATCTEFVAWHQLAEAEAALTDAQQWNYFLAEIDMATNHEENQAKLVASAARCTRELDRLLAAGMPQDIAIKVGNSRPITIAMRDAKAKVCAPLVTASASFAKDVGAARTKREAEIAAPYKKAGAAGDRLKLLVDHADYAMYAIGGRELTTPAQLAKAGVIFELLGPNTADGTYTLRRYQFRGNTLASTRSRTFIVRPRAAFYR